MIMSTSRTKTNYFSATSLKSKVRPFQRALLQFPLSGKKELTFVNILPSVDTFDSIKKTPA